MKCPHDLGRSGDIVLFQHWEQLVFLSQVVFLNLGQILEQTFEFLHPCFSGFLIRWI